MSEPGIGDVTWQDLTVADAERVSAFYGEVVGWKLAPQDMGDYSDYEMNTPQGGCVAGICHARGPNAKMPPQWLIYITVADVTASAARCVQLGGEVLSGPRPMGSQRVCVIRDPAGAVAALVSG